MIQYRTKTPGGWTRWYDHTPTGLPGQDEAYEALETLLNPQMTAWNKVTLKCNYQKVQWRRKP